MSSNDIVIASAGRTAVGAFNGAFANTPAHQLGATVVADVLKRAGVAGEEVDEVILGQILSAGEGQNPARQASIRAGLPKETTAWGLNQLCGSGPPRGSPSACSRSRRVMPISSSPAGRSRCPWRRTARICAVA